MKPLTAPLFSPPAQRLRALRQHAPCSSFVFSWERDSGCSQGFELPLPAGAEHDPGVQRLAERCVKFVLWASGGWRLRLSGPAPLCQAILREYAPDGPRQFDRNLMEQVYGRPMLIERQPLDTIPESRDSFHPVETSWSGCRLGFDLGASDFKVAAVQNGTVTFQAEFPWDPRNASDPSYHYDHLDRGLRTAAKHLPRVEAIGGSTAGIVIQNRMCHASLFRGIPAERYAQACSLFQRLEEAWRVPVRVANDGDITALASYLRDGKTAVLGLAMGSSEAAGYLDRKGSLTGRLNELAFAPVDLSDGAPVDEWSGDTGVGALYFSQQAVGRLATHYGLEVSAGLPLPQRLVEVQELMARGDPGARALYETLGTHLGHSMAWYREFYDYERLLLLGRVTTGAGGDVILGAARAALSEHYPDLADTLALVMPDEKAKRLGQAVAAAAWASLDRNG